jgi:ferrous iron transport protein B
MQRIESRYALMMAGVSGSARDALQEERDKRIAALEAEKARETVEKSYMGRIGKGLAPLLEPVGIDWRGTVAVLSGFVAKEIVVSTMGVLYAVGGDEGDKGEALKSALRKSGMTPLSAYAMMVFVLIYVPCLATVATIRRETNSWKWAFFSMGYSTALAWIVSFAIYQGGKLIGLG